MNRLPPLRALSRLIRSCENVIVKIFLIPKVQYVKKEYSWNIFYIQVHNCANNPRSSGNHEKFCEMSPTNNTVSYKIKHLRHHIADELLPMYTVYINITKLSTSFLQRNFVPYREISWPKNYVSIPNVEVKTQLIMLISL